MEKNKKAIIVKKTALLVLSVFYTTPCANIASATLTKPTIVAPFT